MKKNRTIIAVGLFSITIVLLGVTIYISTLLTDAGNSPTQIRKTKASAQTYNKTVNLQDSFGEFDTPTSAPQNSPAPTLPAVSPATTTVPTTAPTLVAKAPTLVPTFVPTLKPVATTVPVAAVEPTDYPTPTLQPLLAYKSTTVSGAPTLIPVRETGGEANTDPTKTPSPTKKIGPTIVSSLPESGWVQTSTILFIVASTTILFSLLF